VSKKPPRSRRKARKPVKRAQVPDAAPVADDPSTPPRLKIWRREIEVDSLRGLRRALTHITDAMLRGRLSVAKANCATYTLSAVSRVMEVEILEKRVEALEKLENEERGRTAHGSDSHG
jgi:hypothetical protein